jgi:hypothetical protein
MKKYGIFPLAIKNISNEEITRGLVKDTSMVITREMRVKLLCVKVH